MSVVFPRLLVAGVGLVGGSLAAAARRAGLVGEVVGLGRSEANLKTALARGLVDVEPLIERTVPLDDLATAFAAVRRGSLLKAIALPRLGSGA